MLALIASSLTYSFIHSYSLIAIRKVFSCFIRKNTGLCLLLQLSFICAIKSTEPCPHSYCSSAGVILASSCSRKLGGIAGGINLAVPAKSCGNPLARAARKFAIQNFATLRFSSLLKFPFSRLDIQKPSAFLDLSVPPIDSAFDSIAKSLDG